ncbi:diguanylate cyclase (GGDEF) domain-containing protein [Novosphingobium sp. CF614]|uniref:GGDEF domain-containing protein n=1 Tax=Novosphingobium sp. CF614 TaxID=1884364 RepID=UPI0008E3005B|nr:diguanylate cyclase [Novosphingobium sp. CF614]SFF76806.1 diguanylate cyclase (GGDEF) domain-containing protein [Novosphingobium sp. CF614]
MLSIANVLNGNTLIAVNALLCGVSALVMYVVRSENWRAAGIRWWARSNLCFAAGFAMLLSYPIGLSHYFDVLGANLLIDVGAILAYVAVVRFLERPLHALWLIVPSVALMAVEVILFMHEGVNMSDIVLLGATGRAIVTFGAGWQLLHNAGPQLRPASTLSAIFHFLWVLMLFVRVAWWQFAGYAEIDWDPTTPMALTARILLTFVVTPSYLWMLTRRLDYELVRQAHEDALTGVANRRAIWEQAPRALADASRDGRSVCLLMIDVDHFKAVNDGFGHAMGDKVLVGIASELASRLREDEVVARVGGEEFMVLLPGIAVEDAVNLAERLRRAVESLKFPLPGGGHLNCTVSIGMSLFEGRDGNWEGLVQDADSALYCAKRLGRNRVEFAPPHAALIPA